MRQAQIIRSNTFQWALTVAGVFAVFVIMLFGFVYWQTDQYLITRSDRMIARQLNVIAALPGERRLDAIDEHLRQDSRGVQYAGLFAADGRKIATPLDWYPRLMRASAKERAKFEIMPMGIHWPDLDEDISIEGLLQGSRSGESAASLDEWRATRKRPANKALRPTSRAPRGQKSRGRSRAARG